MVCVLVVQGERGQRVFELLSCSIRGGVVPAIHNLGNMFADGRWGRGTRQMGADSWMPDRLVVCFSVSVCACGWDRPPFKRDDELALKLYSMGTAGLVATASDASY